MTSAARRTSSLEKDGGWAADADGSLGDVCNGAPANRASRAASSAAIAAQCRAANSLAAISTRRSSAVARSASSTAQCRPQPWCAASPGPGLVLPRAAPRLCDVQPQSRRVRPPVRPRERGCPEPSVRRRLPGVGALR
eukprot:609483-Rhodomonas_salina.1